MRGFLGYFIYFIFVNSTAFAGDSCKPRFQKLAGELDHEKVTTIGQRVQLPLRDQMSEAVVGLHTHRVYRSDWSLVLDLNDMNRDGILLFDFHSRDPQFVPRIRLIARDKPESEYALRDGQLVERPGRPQLELNLHRREDQSFEDLNLLSPVLDHIALHSKPGEIFEITLNDPVLIDELNMILTETLDRFAFKGQVDAPRRASPYAPENPLSEHHAYDSSTDSYFPVMDIATAQGILSGLTNDFDFTGNALAHIRETDWGKAILEYTDQRAWKLSLEIVGFDLVMREKIDVHGAETAGVRPFVFNYILKLERITLPVPVPGDVL